MTTLSALIIVMAFACGYCANYVGPLRQKPHHHHNKIKSQECPYKKIDKVDALSTIDDLEDE